MTDELCTRPATELAALVRDREVSARELLEAHLGRIDRFDGPEGVNAIVTRDDEAARAAADEADAQLARGEVVGPLHRDTVPARDELVVARLRAAGAIRVGKTNVPEFAAGSHTFNTLFGATHNPYRHGLSAGGSSGGAAAALAAGFVPLAEGSDMGGSLRNPAAFCNVVGLRPTPGRVPSHPTAIGWSQLSVQGPMARTVGDVALGLSVLAGADPRVPISLTDPSASFAAPLPTELTGLRIAWTPDLGGRVPVDPAITEVLMAQLSVFRDLGATVDEDCPDLTGADEAFGVLRAWLFEASFGDAVRRAPDQVKDTIKWNAAKGAELTGADVGRAEVAHTRLYERVVEFFTRYDVLLAPTTQVLPFPVEQEYPTSVAGVQFGDYLEWMRSCTLISATGCPALSVPAGFTPDGLPVGLQVIGAPRADRRVLEVGHAFEQATGHGLRRPELTPAVG